MVFCAHSSQFQMCRSVPQIAVLRIRIMTSLCPTSGFFTRVSVRPGARSCLANSFTCEFLVEPSAAHSQGRPDPSKRPYRAVELLGGLPGAHSPAESELRA